MNPDLLDSSAALFAEVVLALEAAHFARSFALGAVSVVGRRAALALETVGRRVDHRKHGRVNLRKDKKKKNKTKKTTYFGVASRAGKALEVERRAVPIRVAAGDGLLAGNAGGTQVVDIAGLAVLRRRVLVVKGLRAETLLAALALKVVRVVHAAPAKQHVPSHHFATASAHASR
jgi:hypothetical protein